MAANYKVVTLISLILIFIVSSLIFSLITGSGADVERKCKGKLVSDLKPAVVIVDSFWPQGSNLDPLDTHLHCIVLDFLGQDKTQVKLVSDLEPAIAVIDDCWS